MNVRRMTWRFKPSPLLELVGDCPNPGRGWYRVYSFDLSDEVDIDSLTWSLHPEETLVLLVIDIKAYAQGEIDALGLQHLDQIFSFFAKAKKEMIIRIVYDRVGRGMESEPPYLRIVKVHMHQVGHYLWLYSKHIFTLQGIFVGNWGEMHSSKFLGKRQLIELTTTLWKACGKSCFLSVRRPSQWRKLFDVGAHRHIPIGLYDDGIFGSGTHLGGFGFYPRVETTWEDAWCRDDELAFEAVLCKQVPIGGEAALSDVFDRSATFFLKRLRSMRISYLNCIHDEEIIALWKKLGIYDEIGKYLGYRFVLEEARLRRNGPLNTPYQVHVRLRNDGFSNCYRQAKVCLFLKSVTPAVVQNTSRVETIATETMSKMKSVNQTDTESDDTLFFTGAKMKHICLHQYDVTSWETGQVQDIKIPLPKDLKGVYELSLGLIDIKRGNIIRFANQGAGKVTKLGILHAAGQ